MSKLLSINVNEHTEQKNGLTYLSWAWAWAEVLKLDPQATWEAFEFDGFPASFAPDGSALVKVAVSIKGHTKTCWLPVMNHRNQAIKNPDAFAINTAIVRCLTKCISMHGLGLYIYAGEDLPEEDKPEPKLEDRKDAGGVISGPAAVFSSLPREWQEYLKSLAPKISNAFEQLGASAAQELIDAEKLDNECRAGLESLLSSKVRSALKKANNPQKEAA